MKHNVIWLDMEMTGLEPAKHVPIEVAVLVTDANLNVVAEGPNLIIRLDPDAANFIDPWSLEQHSRTGLLDKSIASSITLAMAEQQILDFVKPYSEAGKAILAGSSIHQDRRFIRKYMPEFDKHLHYRMLDVSAVKILHGLWQPEHLQRKLPEKKMTHRAIDDIKESIAELRFYRANIFCV